MIDDNQRLNGAIENGAPGYGSVPMFTTLLSSDEMRFKTAPSPLRTNTWPMNMIQRPSGAQRGLYTGVIGSALVCEA